MREVSIADYGLIGNCRAAALVSRHGSIDWCCLPEFDSPSIFSALLDNEKGGRFSIKPSMPYESVQRYLVDTNVLETTFNTTGGTVRLIDCFTAMTEEKKRKSLFPDHELLRTLEGIEGTVSIDLEYSPAIFYGEDRARLRDDKKLGIYFSWRENIYILATTLSADQLEISENRDRARARLTVRTGDRIFFSLSYSDQSPAVLTELETTALSRMTDTITFWKTWIGQCRYTGVYQEHVRRSALVLKLLTHAPSGAIIAAPTTSLPEKPGGQRNWDYRYCWLRDASFTTRALVNLGLEEEAHAYMNWILHATQLSRPKLQVVYSIYGHARLKEKTLHWLSGYQNSAPVRIGNNADGKFQLDVYGEVLDAVYTYSPLVHRLDKNSKKFIIGLGKAICELWSRPDHGIWEIRSTALHHTHSKVMAWVGLDRLVKLCEKYQWHEADIESFKNTAALIRQEVEEKGFNEALRSYTRELNGESLDASLLVLPLVGFCSPRSPEMLGTMEAICQQLLKDNFLYRYLDIDDGLRAEEGSFGICNFWLSEILAKCGRLEEAMKVFEGMLRCAGNTGLLSEEIDPASGQLLGNYPQGFTHIGLINAALSINEEFLKKRT